MSARLVDTLRRHARWFEPTPDGFGDLFEAIGDAGIVLIGEASHGTHDFYHARAELTKALIERAGFNIVAVEADWPDAYRANRWVRYASDDPDPASALGDFHRFPRWMWRNTDVVEFISWLRAFNGRRAAAAQAGFYGLDLYSLHASVDAVLAYLRKVDPEAAERARFRYSCFEDFKEDTQAYGYAATIGLSESCEQDTAVEHRERVVPPAADAVRTTAARAAGSHVQPLLIGLLPPRPAAWCCRSDRENWPGRSGKSVVPRASVNPGSPGSLEVVEPLSNTSLLLVSHSQCWTRWPAA